MKPAFARSFTAVAYTNPAQSDLAPVSGTYAHPLFVVSFLATVSHQNDPLESAWQVAWCSAFDGLLHILQLSFKPDLS
jgi:hypothetical protein